MRLRTLAVLFVAYVLVSVAVVFLVEAVPGDNWELINTGEKTDMLTRCVRNEGSKGCIFVEIEPKRNSTAPGNPGK